MDPLTHSLTGVALANSGLSKRTPLAMTTLVLAANLPDVDGMSYFVSSDLALSFRRGWTHGVPALLLLPVMLAGLMALIDRFWRQRRNPQAPPAHFPSLLLLATIGTWTHPFLDWLNTYGIRLLMPFDGRWFYGDTLFIIDPWLWLMLGSSAFLIGSRTRRQQVAWTVLALLASMIVLSGARDQPWAWILWFGCLALLVALRASGRTPRSARSKRRLAQAALVAGSCYIAILYTSSVQTRHQVEASLPGLGIVAEDVMAGPLPLRPLTHAIVITTETEFRFGTFNWFTHPRFELEDITQPRLTETDVTRAAFHAPCMQGMANWVRYPWVEIEQVSTDGADDGYIVHLMDARYAKQRTGNFGGSSVRLRSDLSDTCER